MQVSLTWSSTSLSGGAFCRSKVLPDCLGKGTKIFDGEGIHSKNVEGAPRHQFNCVDINF